ncbi:MULTISPECIES: hypothetical protein [Pseudoalteromonas]|uniref:Uncharacterized protein n=1 Tax=Pseudoalteromonas luteoviolacea (strain 2ta16) TaxID=1353533 RepID=V4HT92_PSEL2|nr:MULTISPECIES: hypothetical protein [Pseudoalteromonas]ESP92993.1 hypothetical protein PL2TA16_03625 [Pseudoalteromonas luteoviolacea 2ta16]KZN43194.1 hypothetical protein N483_09755 [Pseudoalteromonas luteoviolacea NCIMB 1944]MCG7549429.1 hypothetical protein [Pseudoalteromonas sp. Of7M-16]
MPIVIDVSQHVLRQPAMTITAQRTGPQRQDELAFAASIHLLRRVIAVVFLLLMKSELFAENTSFYEFLNLLIALFN